MFRRLFWFATGIFTGVWATTKVNRAISRLTPDSLAATAADRALELGGRARRFAHDVRAGMTQRERELTEALGLETSEDTEQASAARPALARTRSLYLGIGDAAVFSGDAYVHRCRNLSTTRAAVSLHVYGGVLDAYRAFVTDASGRYRMQSEIAGNDIALN